MLGCSWIFILEVSYIPIHAKKWERKKKKKKFQEAEEEKNHPAVTAAVSSRLQLKRSKQTDPDISSSKSKSPARWPLYTNCSLTPVKTSVHLPSLNFSFFRKPLQVSETACPDNCMQLKKPPVIDGDEKGGRKAGRREERGGGCIHFLQEHNSSEQQQERRCCCKAVAIWCLLKSRHRSSWGSSRRQQAVQATYMNALMQAVLAQIN